MAIVKYGPPISGIRGSIGGITFSANASGPYAKLWAQPTNPRSPAQSRQRSFLSRMPVLWNALTSLQRANWNTFAHAGAQALINSLGETYFASSFNWFSKCNVRLLRVGRTTISAIPTFARPSAPAFNCFRITPAGDDPDIATGGTATASTETVGREAFHAFDGLGSGLWQSLAPATTGWLQYILPAPAIIRHYSIFENPTLSAAPMDWTFERLDPGPTWTPIDTVTGVIWTDPGIKHFHCCNETPSDTYRINITANGGFGSNVKIHELDFYTAVEDASVIVYPEDQFEVPPGHDLILHIAMGPSTGIKVMYSDFLEVVATQTPGRRFETFQSLLAPIFGTVLPNRTWFAQLHFQTSEGLRSAASTARAETM